MQIDDSHQRQIDETPELLQERLEQFKAQLKDEATCDVFQDAARENAEELDNPAVHLLFLRTEMFDVALAVKRFQRYWENRKKLFGQLKTMQVNMEIVGRGYFRLVKGHERLVVVDPTRIADSYDIEDMVRSFFFVQSQAIIYSQEAQKRGLVYIIDCKHALNLKYFDRALIQKSASTFNDGFPIRVTSIIIMNLHPIGQWFISAFKLLMKPALRSRILVVTSKDTKQRLAQYAGLDRSELEMNVGYEPWKG